jgi:hypothetical protein
MIGYSNVSEGQNRQWCSAVTNLSLLSKYGQDVYNLYLNSFFIFILKDVTPIQQQDKLSCDGFALVV